MSFKINNLTLRNFMSIGNVTQAITFDNHDLTLVLGENLDLGGDDAGARNGVGKSQPLYSKIKTPEGWTTMGDILPGDKVSTPDGGYSTVLDIFPQGERPVYRIHFADGRSTDADEHHLWDVYSHAFRSGKAKTLTTLELIEHQNRYGVYKNKSTGYLYTPNIIPTDINDSDLPLDPYFLGAMIGDGSFSVSGVGFSNADDELIETMSKRLPDNTVMVKKHGDNYDYSFKCIKRVKHRQLLIDLKALKLYGCLSDNKFIPEIYKSSSLSQKIKLLQGMVDTDGYVGKNGSVSICTVSEQLAYDIQELVWSIGGSARINLAANSGYKKDGVFIKCKQAYNISIMYHTPKLLSNLTRKKDSLPGDNYQYKNRKPRITQIEYIGKEITKCILIDHPDHLYITDNYIVTHNTTILNGLSYALYGMALTKIKKDNLINKSNSKNMMVTCEFERNGQVYHIERGRRRNVLKFYAGENELHVDDEAQGDSRETQKAIEDSFGMSHDMFKHILALNTYTEPFLSLNQANQRNIIEQLLGITLLSEKADNLKELNRETKRKISSIEARIAADIDANKRIEKQIKSMELRSRQWAKQRELDVKDIEDAVATLGELDVDAEIKLHGDLVAYNLLSDNIAQNEKDIKAKNKEIVSNERALTSVIEDLETLSKEICHTCGQEFHGKQYKETVKIKKASRVELDKEKKKLNKQLEKLMSIDLGDLGEPPVTFYQDLEDAYNHKNSIINLEEQLKNKKAEKNPYTEQINEMNDTAIKEIDYTELNEFGMMRDHQDFLYRLLTSKDSFIRKRIIEQNLAHLNARLSYYLEEMGLPHQVKFQNDLNVEITELGRDLDFDNLSRGERNRLILSLSWAFRDVWEALYQPINLLFVDELIDSGLDSKGVDAALGVLKKMTRERNKSIWLVSHRDELISRVGSILKVRKENGYTNFAQDE